MAFLKRNNRLFYTVLLDSDVCKVYFRELNARKVVVKEGLETFDIENASQNIKNYIKKSGTFDDSDYLSVLQTSYRQGLTDSNVDGFYTQYIDTSVYSYASINDIENIKSDLDIHINEFISPFKVLYFLFKNQQFEGTSLFILKFAQSAALMVADKDMIYFAKMVDLTDSFIEIIESNPKISLDDEDELFYRAIRDFMNEFYDNHDPFINSIYIYDIGSLGPETGYYIFTRIFIKTNIVPINLMDFINKINIKENF